MTEEFTNVQFFLRTYELDDLSGYWLVWTDVTSDVLHNPAPRGSVGIRNNNLMDKFADGGEMTIALRNDDGAYTTAYLSSDYIRNINALRMVCTWDGVSVVKFEGVLKPNSVKINIDTLNNPYVELTFIDFISWATNFTLDNIEYQTNKNVGQAVLYILTQLNSSVRNSSHFLLEASGENQSPDSTKVNFLPRYLEFDTGVYTFPDVFDLQNKSTTIGGECRRLIESELGYMYQRYGVYDDDAIKGFSNTLVIENRQHRRIGGADNGALDNLPVYSSDHDGDTPLLSDGTSLPLLSNGTNTPLLSHAGTVTITLSDLMVNGKNEFVYKAHNNNFFRIKTRPRKVDAAATTVLWTLENSTEIAAGGTVAGLRGRYRDPDGGASYVNAIAITDPVINTDYKAYSTDGTTGTDLTSSMVVTTKMYPAEVEISLVNAGTQTLYTGGDILFQVRGQGVYQYDTTDVIIDLRTSRPYYIMDKAYPISGLNEYSIDLFYKTDANDIISSIDYSVYWNNYPHISAQSIELLANKDTKNMRLWMYGDVGTCFNLDVDSNSINYEDQVYINGFSFELINGKYIKWQIIPFEDARALITRP